jgi:hypothetical protein
VKPCGKEKAIERNRGLWDRLAKRVERRSLRWNDSVTKVDMLNIIKINIIKVDRTSAGLKQTMDIARTIIGEAASSDNAMTAPQIDHG